MVEFKENEKLTENEKKAIENYKEDRNKQLAEFDRMMYEESGREKELMITDSEGKKYTITTAQLHNLTAQKAINRDVLVKVKHIKSTDISSDHVILRYFDAKEGVWKSEKRLGEQDRFVPEIYKEHYRFLLTQTNMVFYCLLKDLEKIVKLLKEDEVVVKKVEDTRNQVIDKFISDVVGIPAVKKEDKQEDEKKVATNLKKVANNTKNSNNEDITDDDLKSSK